MFDGKLTWSASDGHDQEIFTWDDGDLFQVTDNDVEDDRPAIWGDELVWTRSDGTDTEIFFSDLLTNDITQITDNDYDDRYPRIFAGETAWSAIVPDGGSHIFLATRQSPIVPEPSALLLTLMGLLAVPAQLRHS